MQLVVYVKPGAHRDRVWRTSAGLLAHLRISAPDGTANDYLLRYLSGCLRVAPNIITITSGRSEARKVLNIAVAEADLQPMLKALPEAPQADLFADE